MASYLIFLLIGLSAGVVSGIFGIGGAVLVIPLLVILCNFDQHLAQGTSLILMLPPIGLLAAMEYYRKGFVDIKAAAFICAAFVIGGYLGAKVAVNISGLTLRRVFACFLMFVAARMLAAK